MKLQVTCCIMLSFGYISASVFPQVFTKKAAVAQEAKTADDEGDKKVNRFPDGLDHDFGKVARGTYAKHAFRIANISDSPVEILVRTSPGAVKVRASKAKLEPKEVGKLLVVVETSRFVGSKTVAIFLTMRKGGGPVEDFRFSITCDSDETLKLDPKILLQNRLMEAACKGVSIARDGFPPSPGVYLGDEKSPDIATVLKEGADVNGPDQKGAHRAHVCIVLWLSGERQDAAGQWGGCDVDERGRLDRPDVCRGRPPMASRGTSRGGQSSERTPREKAMTIEP